MSRLAKLRLQARRLRRDASGVAMLEFAFAAPIFFALVMGGLEVANLALTHMRVSNIAMTVADNAGRKTSGIDEANVYEVFAGADVIGDSIGFHDNGRLVLSSIEHNGRNGGRAGQTVVWQRCWGDLEFDPMYAEQGDGDNDSSLADGVGADGHKIMALPGTAVMFVEATYDYQPLVGSGWFKSPRIRYESAFNVRGRINNDLTNTQDLDQLVCSDEEEEE